jgi:glutamyl-tRNA reductase
VELAQVGVDHRSAPLTLRERVAVPSDAVGALLRAVLDEGWAAEALCVSTCNRTELYVVTASPEAADLALASLRRLVPGAPDPAEGIYVRRVGEDAAEHLFRVAAGLESAIVGETEVQGQVKEALRQGVAAGAVGRFLDRLGQAALRAGKRVRAETGLSRGVVSHGHAAAEVARRVFGDLRDRDVLVVGAGEMASRAAAALSSLGGGTFVVANRSPEPAAALAEALGPSASAVGLDEVAQRLARAHVAVFAGGEASLSREAVAGAIARRREPLLVLDYGVPRNVSPEAADLPGVFLYDLEALERLVEGSLASRRQAVPEAARIVAEEVARFRSWHRTLRAAPAIRSLVAWAEEVRRGELAHLPPDASEETRATVDEVTRRLVERLLTRPAARVRQGVEEGDPSLPTPDHLRSLFGLPPDEDGAP